MAVDSNMPYNRVNVQANNNDTVWNGAAWGAAAGLGTAGLAYGATMHGARHLSALNYKVAGNKTVREQMRADKLQTKGKPFMGSAALEGMQEYRLDKADAFSGKMGKIQQFGGSMFGSKKKMAASAAVGLMGGMLAGAGVDHAK